MWETSLRLRVLLNSPLSVRNRSPAPEEISIVVEDAPGCNVRLTEVTTELVT